MKMVRKGSGKLMGVYNNIPLSAKSSLWFLFANIFQKAVMVIFTPLFTRLMTTDEFSKFAVFQSWEAILTVFATLNISNYATAKALVEFKDDRDNFVISAELLTLLLTSLVAGIFCGSTFWIKSLRTFPLWIVILLFIDIVSVSFFSFWSQLERFCHRYKALTLVSVLMGIASPSIAFLIIYITGQLNLYKGWARILGLVIANSIVAIVIFYKSLKISKRAISIKYWSFCITYCIPLIPHFLSMAFLQKIGQLFVDHYCGSSISGIYALASSLALLMMVFNDALTKTLVPWTYQKLSEKKYKEINGPVILSLGLIAILDIAMALIAPELVFVFADNAYGQAVYAVPPLVAVCFFGFLYNTFANIEYYYKETKYVSMASIVAGSVILLANFMLVPHFGYIAAAYSSLLSYITYALMHYFFMKKTISKYLDGTEIYDEACIVKMSVLFTVIILSIPYLYKYFILRFVIVILIFVILLIKCSPAN